jgi:hypothetical protein
LDIAFVAEYLLRELVHPQRKSLIDFILLDSLLVKRSVLFLKVSVGLEESIGGLLESLDSLLLLLLIIGKLLR